MSADPTRTSRPRAEAEARLARTGRAWSADCRRVLEQLLQSATPVKAYSLIEGLSSEGRAAYPATVYRALAALEQAGLVHRIASLNAFAACAGGDHSHTLAFLICERCGGAEEGTAHATPVALTPPQSRFEVRSAVVELRGPVRKLCIAAAQILSFRPN